MAKVELSSGEIIEAIPNHPFFVHGTWFQVRDLQTGDTLKTYSNTDNWIVVDSLVLQLGQFTVYNFTVADYHTYYVGQGEVLVHNCGGKTPKAGKGKNKLKPDNEAKGDHSVFKRDDNGDIYKYETYEKTKTGHDNPVKRFDGGKPDGTPGAPHRNKQTKEKVPTPHVQGKKIPGGARSPQPNEIPNNKRFNNGN